MACWLAHHQTTTPWRAVMCGVSDVVYLALNGVCASHRIAFKQKSWHLHSRQIANSKYQSLAACGNRRRSYLHQPPSSVVYYPLPTREEEARGRAIAPAMRVSSAKYHYRGRVSSTSIFSGNRAQCWQSKLIGTADREIKKNHGAAVSARLAYPGICGGLVRPIARPSHAWLAACGR